MKTLMVFGVRLGGNGLWVTLGIYLFAGSVCEGERPGEEAGAGLWETHHARRTRKAR